MHHAFISVTTATYLRIGIRIYIKKDVKEFIAS